MNMRIKRYRIKCDHKIERENDQFISVPSGMGVYGIRFGRDLITNEKVFLCAYPNPFHNTKYWNTNAFNPIKRLTFIASKKDLQLIKTTLRARIRRIIRFIVCDYYILTTTESSIIKKISKYSKEDLMVAYAFLIDNDYLGKYDYLKETKEIDLIKHIGNSILNRFNYSDNMRVLYMKRLAKKYKLQDSLAYANIYKVVGVLLEKYLKIKK
jgi:hypothetical protein